MQKSVRDEWITPVQTIQVRWHSRLENEKHCLQCWKITSYRNVIPNEGIEWKIQEPVQVVTKLQKSGVIIFAKVEDPLTFCTGVRFSTVDITY